MKTQATVIEQTVAETHRWLDRVGELAELRDEAESMSALRAVLHAVRDRLTVEEAVDLSAQLPELVRGIYFEGWKPAAAPSKERRVEPFLEHIRAGLRAEIREDAEKCAAAVLTVVEEHVDAGVLGHVKGMLPKELRTLWPGVE